MQSKKLYELSESREGEVHITDTYKSNKQSLLFRIITSPYASAYFIFNVVLLVSFLPVRYVVLKNSPESVSDNLARWEINAYRTLVLTFLFKLWRSPTREFFLGSIFFYSQVVVVMVAWVLDRRIGTWYAVLSADKVVKLTQRQLETAVAEGGRQSAWLVMCCAHWVPACGHLESLFAELSTEYASSALHFGRLDLACFPTAADQLLLDSGAFSGQLPAFLMFENGVETKRLPRFGSASSFFPVPPVHKEDLVRTFELDMWLLRAIKAQAVAGRKNSQLGDAAKRP
eukprot:jgi/Mesen1/5063/ME000252S04171